MKIAFIVIVACANFTAASASIFVRFQRSVDVCGVPKISTGLIVQGQSFSRGSYPWIVALMLEEHKPPMFFCAGTLISKTFVISAAHCIHQKQSSEKLLPRDILVFFGAHDLEDLYEPGRFALSPKDIFLHPKWNPGTTQYDGDLSLLEFEAGNINFNNYVQPICLWETENEPNITEGIVTGWGKSENPERKFENLPKLIKAPIQANEDCWLEENSLLQLSSKKTFCAGLGDGSGVCHGDSGGGLFLVVNGVYYLKGMVSSSLIKEGGCDVTRKAIYTNVFKFMDWIRMTAGSVLDIITTPSPVRPAATKNVFCSHEERESFLLNKTVNHCDMKKQIENENYILGPPIDTSCEVFYIYDNKDVKYLPKQIGDILPNLKEINVQSCGLTIVRDFYFKNMRKLRFLTLQDNEIVTIEPNAFKDLVSVETLWLKYNFIRTLDENIFAPMTNLEQIYLTSNKIKFLSPSTFKIPGGKIEVVDLRDNICIHQQYNNAEQRNRIESDLRAQCSSNSKALSSQDLKNVVCGYDQEDSILLNRKTWRCVADQKIESEDYFVLKEPVYGNVEIFDLTLNKYVKFLPKNIGEKFPNLKEFDASDCGLTIVRNFYFGNMRNLKFLSLIHNKIATIESEAFKDLVSVEKLWLHDNLIQTLDEKLFDSMTSVNEIHLRNNKIKFLSPETFKIPGGSLWGVDLRGNACIDQNYRSDWDKYNLNFYKLESDLKAKCSQN